MTIGLTQPIAQLGLFFDFPPFIGPILISVGFLLLLLWVIENHVLPPSAGTLDDVFARTLIIVPLLLGMFLTALGVVVQNDALWSVALLLFLAGRVIEGAVFIRLLRKIAHYAQIILSPVIPHDDSSETTRMGVVSKVTLIIGYHILAFFCIIGFAGLVALTAGAGLSDGQGFVPPVWAAYVGTATVFIFMWDMRSLLRYFEFVPLAGLTFCIVGAELFNLPEVGIPPQTVTAVLGAVPPGILDSLLTIQSFAISEILALVLGQIASFFGIVLSLVFLWSFGDPSWLMRSET